MEPEVVREVLIATDFSETSKAAARLTHSYARAFGARLHVLHVSWPDGRDLQALLTRLVADLEAAVPPTVVCLRGDAAEKSYATRGFTPSTSLCSARTAERASATRSSAVSPNA